MTRKVNGRKQGTGMACSVCPGSLPQYKIENCFHLETRLGSLPRPVHLDLEYRVHGVPGYLGSGYPPGTRVPGSESGEIPTIPTHPGTRVPGSQAH
eukprot:3171430-Rhodomonas_salina.1